jgi:hypothetical protein
MKTIIAGSRKLTDMTLLLQVLQHYPYPIEEIVSGGANGVDRLGEIYAQTHDVPLRQFKADWKEHGRSAGHIRNGKMAIYGEALIALWDGSSRGTKNMIEQAMQHSLVLTVVTIL